jgi:hypothetical protein
VIIRDETGRVLFQEKHDGTWSLPGWSDRTRRKPTFGKSKRRPVSRSNRNESSAFSTVRVSGTNIRTETRSNTPWSCLSARKRVCPSNWIAKKPNVWTTSLRRRLLLWASPIARRSFRPCFDVLSTRLKDEASPSKANLTSIVFGIKRDVPLTRCHQAESWNHL